jgi:hypothetical protein
LTALNSGFISRAGATPGDRQTPSKELVGQEGVEVPVTRNKLRIRTVVNTAIDN